MQRKESRGAAKRGSPPDSFVHLLGGKPVSHSIATLRKSLSFSVVAIALSAPFAMHCGKLPKVPGVPEIPGTCSLDASSAEAVESFDFAGEFKMEAAAAGKLKAGVASAIDLKAVADLIDADLLAACGGLAKDLGKGGEFKTGEEACKAAITVMGEAKAKLGAKASVALAVEPPQCGVDLDVVASCSGKCDASVSGGQAKVECEPGKLSGTCEAKCKGSCQMDAAAKCEGKCEGKCEAKFSGSCAGTCEGKCDGKNAKGACSGKCEGKCDAGASGTCGGNCSGSCQLMGEASCKGTCSGSCSAEMKAPKCNGEVTPPKVSAECKARCDAHANAKMTCKPAKVTVRIDGAADAKFATEYKATLEKNLPGVLKVAIGTGDRASKMAASVAVAIDGAKAGAEGAVKASPAMAAKLTACVAAPFKGAVDAAASIKANVKVSVDVKASASASSSASGKAG